MSRVNIETPETFVRRLLGDWQSQPGRYFHDHGFPRLAAMDRVVGDNTSPDTLAVGLSFFLLTIISVTTVVIDRAFTMHLPGEDAPNNSMIDTLRNAIFLSRGFEAGLFFGFLLLFCGIKKMVSPYQQNDTAFRNYFDKVKESFGEAHPYFKPQQSHFDDGSFESFHLQVITSLLSRYHRANEYAHDKLDYWRAVAFILIDFEKYFPHQALPEERTDYMPASQAVQRSVSDARSNSPRFTIQQDEEFRVAWEQARQRAQAFKAMRNQASSKRDPDIRASYSDGHLTEQEKNVRKIVAQLMAQAMDDQFDEVTQDFYLEQVNSFVDRGCDMQLLHTYAQEQLSRKGIQPVFWPTPFATQPVAVPQQHASRHPSPLPAEDYPPRNEYPTNYHYPDDFSPAVPERNIIQPVANPRELCLTKGGLVLCHLQTDSAFAVADNVQKIRINGFEEATNVAKNTARKEGVRCGEANQDRLIELKHQGSITAIMYSHLRRYIKLRRESAIQLKILLTHLIDQVFELGQQSFYSFAIHLTALLKDSSHFEHWEHFIQHESINTQAFLELPLTSQIRLIYILLSGPDCAKLTALSLIQDPLISEKVLTAFITTFMTFLGGVDQASSFLCWRWLAECSSDHMIQFYRNHPAVSAQLLVKLAQELHNHQQLVALFWYLRRGDDITIQLTVLNQMRQIAPQSTIPLLKRLVSYIKQQSPNQLDLKPFRFFEHLVYAQATPLEKKVLYELLEELHAIAHFTLDVENFIKDHAAILLEQAVDVLAATNQRNIDSTVLPDKQYLAFELVKLHDVHLRNGSNSPSAWFILFKSPDRAIVVMSFLHLLVAGFQLALRRQHEGDVTRAINLYRDVLNCTDFLVYPYENLFSVEADKVIVKMLSLVLDFSNNVPDNFSGRNCCEDRVAKFLSAILSKKHLGHCFAEVAQKIIPRLLNSLRKSLSHTLSPEADEPDLLSSFWDESLLEECQDNDRDLVLSHLILAYAFHVFSRSRASMPVNLTRGLFRMKSYDEIAQEQVKYCIATLAENRSFDMEDFQNIGMSDDIFSRWMAAIQRYDSPSQDASCCCINIRRNEPNARRTRSRGNVQGDGGQRGCLSSSLEMDSSEKGYDVPSGLGTTSQSNTVRSHTSAPRSRPHTEINLLNDSDDDVAGLSVYYR